MGHHPHLVTRSESLYGCTSVVGGLLLQHAVAHVFALRAKLPRHPSSIPDGALLRVRRALAAPPGRVSAGGRAVGSVAAVMGTAFDMELLKCMWGRAGAALPVVGPLVVQSCSVAQFLEGVAH